MRTPLGQRVAVVSAVVLSSLLVLSGATVGGVADRNPAKPTAQFGQFDQLGQLGQYKVSIDNATIRTWVLRNVTVQNATVDSVVVRNLRADGETRRNVTLRNVAVAELDIDDGTLNNVTANRIVVRNRTIFDVPGGDLFDPGVRDRVIERSVLADVTVEGANFDTLVVRNMSVENASVPEPADQSPVSPGVTNPSSEPRPAVVLQNGTVESAVIRNATAGEWSADGVNPGNSTE